MDEGAWDEVVLKVLWGLLPTWVRAIVMWMEEVEKWVCKWVIRL